MVYSDIRAEARDRLRGNWGPSIGTALVASLLGGAITRAGSGSSGGSGSTASFNAAEFEHMPEPVITFVIGLIGVIALLSLLQFIIGGTVQLGYAGYLLRQNRRQDPRFSDLFSEFYRFGRGFAQKFLVGLYSVLWTLLFVIPGIIKSFSYAMTPFILADHPEMTANEAITASRKLMDGHKWELFVLSLTFIGWQLLCALTLGIGLLWLVPYQNAALAAFYREISGKNTYIEA